MKKVVLGLKEEMMAVVNTDLSGKTFILKNKFKKLQMQVTSWINKW